jgi:hypothetical protein
LQQLAEVRAGRRKPVPRAKIGGGEVAAWLRAAALSLQVQLREQKRLADGLLDVCVFPHVPIQPKRVKRTSVLHGARGVDARLEAETTRTLLHHRQDTLHDPRQNSPTR